MDKPSGDWLSQSDFHARMRRSAIGKTRTREAARSGFRRNEGNGHLCLPTVEREQNIASVLRRPVDVALRLAATMFLSMPIAYSVAPPGRRSSTQGTRLKPLPGRPSIPARRIAQAIAAAGI
jgi:hypothetical protein